MATDFQIPSALDLQAVEQEVMPRLTAQRPVFDFFPIEEDDASEVAWEQEDNFIGLQQLRGLNGAPPVVARTGAKRYIMEPGVYGEFSLIDERELTKRRAFGQIGRPIDIADLVGREQNRLFMRRLDRVELIIWTLLATGTFSVSTLHGAVHTDTYAVQTASAAVAWGTYATATPLADLRTVQLLARGHGVVFDETATMWMNRTTANKLFSNVNPADLYGRRTQGLGTYNSPAQVNQLLAGDGLPNVRIYDEGYFNSSGTFTLFIPNDKVVVIGRRTSGTPIGAYKMTRNANNPDMAPGAYTKVVDNGEDNVPRSIAVHDGHNGGPALKFPSAIVVLTT
jgi:hypothetical protein